MSNFAEQSVAGALLIDASCYSAVRAIVGPGDFSSAPCGAILRAVGRLVDAGEPVDPVTIQANAARYGDDLTSKYLMELMDVTPSTANAVEYARAVRDASVRRSVLTIAEQLADRARGRETPIAQLIADGVGQLQQIVATGNKLTVSSEEMANEYLDRLDRLAEGAAPVVQTEIKPLDKLLGGGFVTEGLYILAARPGVGKTTLGMKIAENVAKREPTLFVSLEMSREQLTSRRLAVRTGIWIPKILSGTLKSEELTEVCGAAAETAESRLRINQAPSATVADIALMARSMPGLRLIVVDYLGLIQSDGRTESIYERMTANSAALKRLARSTGAPVLCLAQLNRESEKRTDHRPQMQDLRDSGAIEQDADGILMLHRPAKYWPPEKRPGPSEPELLEVEVVKNRHGPTGRINLDFYGTNGRIV